MKYRKKPVVIEAVQLTNDNETIANCIEWVEKIDMSTSIIGRNACISQVIQEGGMLINTLEGVMKASFGDYIIKGVNGELYPCKPDIFEKTYEKVDDEADDKILYGEVFYGGSCGGGMSHYINIQKVNEDGLKCPICASPVYIQETSGITVCIDPNCEYGHTQ